MTLRELVAAWQTQEVRCKETFDVALAEINRELDAVGGYATTSPDAKGYCRDFHRSVDGFGGGVERAGERYGGTGPHADTVAPHHPEVGDRCHALELAWRKEALALTESLYAVRAHIAGMTGLKLNHADADRLARDGLGPEHVALALLKELP